MVLLIFSIYDQIIRNVLAAFYVVKFNVDCIACWKISEALLAPNVNLLNLFKPLCAIKVVMYLRSGLRDNWWYALDKSNLLKWLAPFNLAIKSSSVGLG